jgi:carbon monoxide dehydrogenase subunit G
LLVKRRGTPSRSEPALAVHVPFDLQYEFEVRAPLAEVFGVLADVPVSASHFPKLHRLVDLGGNAFRWELERVGTEQIHLQTVYASKYRADRRSGTVVWTPVDGVGNARVGGSWAIRASGAGTRLVLKLDGEVVVPLPALLAPVVRPLILGENEKLVEKYIDNLIRRFGGEVRP